MGLSKNCKIKLFQQMTGWSVDKIRANKKQINALLNDESVLFIEQELTEEQKTQARENIDAGSNVDLSNALGKLAVLEDIMGITLDPELDEKYYEYFTIEASENNTTVYFKQSSQAVADGMDVLKVEVSTDDGTTWTEVTAAPAEDDVPGATLAELNSGDKVLVRGRNEAYGYYSETKHDGIQNCNFFADAPCYVYGNIMSLIGGDDFARSIKVENLAFKSFFSGSDWVLSKNGKELLLPATTLAPYCYDSMFLGCSSLEIAPKLSAIVLADYCCKAMFAKCTALKSAPELPATILALHCYEGMFFQCTSLEIAPELPATTLAPHCYENMFYQCTSLEIAPELPATVLEDQCYLSMFFQCTSLEIAPELPATTLAYACYRHMFSHCTNLINVQEKLPATNLADRCYASMFRDCSKLEVAPELPATVLASQCYNTMFCGCTNLRKTPELPALTLVSRCYESLFLDCPNVTQIKAMFTTEPGAQYTQEWVSNVSPNGTFVKNSAATWNVTGIHGVPDGWTVETTDA